MVMRVHKTSDFTVMSNTHFKEKSMSLQAIGLLSLMLSLPDNWDYSIAGLCSIRKEKETAIKNTLNELKKFGYLTITKIRNSENGKYEYIYDIFENPHIGLPGVDDPGVDNPAVDEPAVDHPAVVNQGQVNTNVSSTYESNTKESSTDESIYPASDRKAKTVELAERFERFWEHYPRKVSKGQAIKAWAKINPDDSLTEKIITSVETAKKCDGRFKEERFTPHPATWLNGMEWENQYEQEIVNNNGTYHRSTGFRTELPEYLTKK
ncbi:MAG: hypothetical protein VB118_07165 [Oscillospiraceae bacterium]|nr:hypothetical protein [Oscillospiraceae bacterium]